MGILNTSEVAKLLECSTRRVQYLVTKGELTPVKQFHKYNLFDEKQVINYKVRKENQND
jgi:DNA-binding transcriptional MerR regulator